MKKQIKRIGALVLAGVLALGMSISAFAAAGDPAELTNGEVGGTTFPKDDPDTQSKKVILKKEITAYNYDESKVNAPTITYNYAITAGPAGTSITDEASDHKDGIGAVTVATKAGVGNPTITESVSWTTGETLNASTDGTANEKDIIIDFSSVVFDGTGNGAGVYRYKITETPAVGANYAKTGVTEGNTNHVRFLDVYVRASSTYTNGTLASDWDIYGYVCVDDSTTGNTAITKDTAKTNGFVDADASETASTADKYYTYNLTISKTVENDAYAAATHKFPFTVIFTNSDIDQNILLKTTETGNVTDFEHVAGAPTWSGHADLLSGGSIKYIGIPMGTDTEVYETNNMTGATYTVTTTRTNATTDTATESAITDGSTITTTTQADPKPAYQSTKTVINTTKDADDDLVHSVAITNTLVLISPTGVALRFAPYAVILAAGLALLFVSRRRRADDEE